MLDMSMRTNVMGLVSLFSILLAISVDHGAADAAAVVVTLLTSLSAFLDYRSTGAKVHIAIGFVWLMGCLFNALAFMAKYVV